MTATAHVAFNPLPWFFIGGGFNRAAAPPIDAIYREIRDAGFGAVHAEVPEGMSVDAYRKLLSEVGLEPAPGYFSAAFSNSAAIPGATEAAKRGLIRVPLREGRTLHHDVHGRHGAGSLQ